ncbi:cell division protein FtsQ [Variovorax sp. RCC_210]|uniref:alginate O-acetyltransferase AlgX-related protein n=1 Tax=Variovorax sp. RCC_210 TaxID=3239217 RepID=UPI003523C3C0
MRDGLHWAVTTVLLAAIGTAFIATWPNLGAVRSHVDTSLLHDAAARRALTKELVTTPFTEALARWQRQASWLLLRDLGPEVKRGEENWLFLDEELQLHRDRAAHATARAEAVSAIARALADRHIALLVVVVPDKSRIEAAHLGTLRRPPQLDARVRDWTAKLGAANVATLDLSPALAGASPSPFLHTDTHWNERGSWLAAHAVAQRLQEMHALQGEPVPSVVVSKQVREVHGDLLHLAGIDGLPASLQPAPDTDAQSVVETRNDSTDLFGTTAVPSTVLIGTSFSRRSNFVSFLQLASRALVADFAMDGGDFSGAARRYFGGEDFVKTPPRTIVWEVPERAIEAPIGETEAQWLRQPLPPR